MLSTVTTPVTESIEIPGFVVAISGRNDIIQFLVPPLARTVPLDGTYAVDCRWNPFVVVTSVPFVTTTAGLTVIVKVVNPVIPRESVAVIVSV